VIVQFEGAKRNLTLIFGKHTGNGGDDVFVTNTGGDFDPAPPDDEDLDDDGEAELFGFRRQPVTA
jgi:hypothetical protein